VVEEKPARYLGPIRDEEGNCSLTTHAQTLQNLNRRIADLVNADPDVQGPPLQLALNQILNEIERSAQTEIAEATKLREQAKRSEIKAESLRAIKSTVYNVLNAMANQAEMAARESEKAEAEKAAAAPKKKKTRKKTAVRKKK
jgi:hypothetical protein